MDSDGFSPHDAYVAIWECKTGKQLDRFFRATSFVLGKWRQYGILKPKGASSPRELTYGRPDNGCMTPIEFDKLMNIISRTWAEMFKLTGEPKLDSLKSDETPSEVPDVEKNEYVWFRPPFVERRGTHGVGQAREGIERNAPTAYATKMLIQLSLEEDIPYIEVKRNKDPQAKTKPRDFETDASKHPKKVDEVISHKDYVLPGIETSGDGDFWEGFSRKEVEFLHTLANGLKHLGATDIRVIGTHRTADATRGDVTYELRNAASKIKTIVTRLEKHSSVSVADARAFQNDAIEAERKAISNEKRYRLAYDRLLQEIDDDTVKAAFKKTQDPPDQIWREDYLHQNEAAEIHSAAEYVFALAHFTANPEHRKGRGGAHAKHCWERGRPFAIKHRLATDVQHAFEQDDQLNSIFKDDLIRALTSLRYTEVPHA